MKMHIQGLVNDRRVLYSESQLKKYGIKPKEPVSNEIIEMLDQNETPIKILRKGQKCK
jgi:hypothetical protein